MIENKYIIKEHHNFDKNVEVFIEDNGTIFHQYNYLTAVGSNYCCYVIRDKKSNEILSVLPLVKTAKFGLKSYHIPPLTYQFGPIFNKDIDHSKIFNLFYHEINRSNQLDFKFFIEDQGVYNYKSLNFSIEAYQTFIIENNSNFSILDIHSSKRRYLKKLILLLEKGDIKIEKGRDCIPDILKIYEINSKETGFDPKIKVLKKIIENLNDNQFYAHVLSSKNGEAIAGTFCPYDKYSAYYLINTSLKVDDNLLNKLNILSTFLAIEKARELKLNFDFEGSNISGIAKYYEMMGGKLKINFRLQKTKSIYYNMLKILKIFKQSFI